MPGVQFPGLPKLVPVGKRTLDKYPPLDSGPSSSRSGSAASNQYVVAWNHNDMSEFRRRMRLTQYKRHVKEVVIKGSALDYDPGDILESTISSSLVDKVQVTWDTEELLKVEGQDANVPEEASIRVIAHVLKAVVDSFSYPFPVRELVLEKVSWKLFAPERRGILSSFSGLEHLKLCFDPPDEYDNATYRNVLGRALRVDSLQTLSLHFEKMASQSSDSDTQKGLWAPPDFGSLVEHAPFPRLRELTLENATLESQPARYFFLAHQKSLEKVSLISMWNDPEIASGKSLIGRGLREASLEEIQLRGTWMQLVATNDSNRHMSEIVWCDSRKDDRQAMTRAEWKILKKGKNRCAELPPGLDPDWVDPQATRWQKFRQLWEDFFDEKIRHKKKCGLKKCGSKKCSSK
jgi:hypothetical protein